ncbi:MAG: hypothetical protein FJ241_10485 [Nitrospira sp.]|nr:hypothetical protein [Nitrospira sp.]
MRSFKKYLLPIALFSALALILVGCGGGGGGGTTTTGGGGGTTSSSVQISGLVGSGGAGGASVSKAQTPTENPMANAIVEITAYDKNSNLTGSATTTSLSTGVFNANINLSNNGGYLVVTVKRTGFADYSKRIDFETPSDVNISAILNAVATAIIPVSGNSVTVSSTGKEVVTIAVFKNKKTGKQSIVTGSKVAIMKQNGTPPDLEIEIPTSSLTGVTSLKADLNSFDPNTDASSFPGQYKDDKGNQIVSLGFDYINLTTNSGENLGVATTKAIKQGKLTKAQATGTYITRWIGSTSCSTLLKDYCIGSASDNSLCSGLTVAEKAGFNVPVYTYNPTNGTWIMLGIGTIDKDGDDSIETLGNAGDDDNADGTPDDLATDLNADGKINEEDYKQQCTTNNGEYLRILVSNEDFIRQWWNLDYPLTFELPKEICIEKKFVSGGQPVEGIWVELYDDDYDPQSFNYAWGTTGSDGKVKLKVALTNNADTDRQATLYYWDYINDQEGTETVTLGDSPNCTSKTNTITKQAACQVEGYVKDDTGKAIADQYVAIYSSAPYYYNDTNTNSNGYFKMDARCNTIQDVYVGWDWQPKKRFNPNNNKNDYPTSEQNDNGTLVTLTDVVFENQAPYAYGWIYAESIFAGDSVGVEVWGWDNECDAPLNWTIKSNSTTLKSGTWNDCWGDSYQEISFPNEGTYPVTVSVTDSKGKTGTADIGTVYVSGAGANQSPVIYYADTDNYLPAKNTGITLWGGAYDWDSANLTTKWYADGVAIPNCSDSSNEYWIETACTYTTPNVDGKLIPIKFEVSDGTNTVSWEFEIYVGGVPGEFNIIIQKKGKR